MRSAVTARIAATPNGMQLTVPTGNLQGVAEPDCLPVAVGGVDRVVSWLYPDGLDQRNMLFTLFHAIYTPGNHEATEPVPGDRPYAAAVLLGAGYNARRGNGLHTTQLRLGFVGPPALGLALFLSLDARMVVHNITLDGSTWRPSPGVGKRRWVGDFGYGAAVVHGSWKLVLA
jgi:hypothetical protein